MEPEVIGLHTHILSLQTLIGPAITLFIALIAGVFAYGKLVNKVGTLSIELEKHHNEANQKIGKIEATQLAIRTIGVPSRYVSMRDCTDMHEDCRDEICGKLTTINNALGEISKTASEDRKSLNEFMNKISVFIGTVNEFMRREDKNQTPYMGPDRRA